MVISPLLKALKSSKTGLRAPSPQPKPKLFVEKVEHLLNDVLMKFFRPDEFQ
jgi:hypothetical protein